MTSTSAPEIERLVYCSVPAGSNIQSDMDAILPVSIWANARHRITGVLGYAPGFYVQVLEGPAAKLDALLTCLRKDARHTALTVLDRRPTDTRLFPGWSMARVDMTIGHPAPADLLDDSDALAALLVDMFERGQTSVA